MLRSAAPPLIRSITFSTQATPSTSFSEGSVIFNNKINRVTRHVYLRTLPLKTEPDLADSVEQIGKDIEYQTERLCNKHSWRCKKSTQDEKATSGNRAETHLHMSVLALASYRVLTARLRGNEEKAMKLIYTGFGTARNAENAKRLPAFWITKAVMAMSGFGRGGVLGTVERMTGNVKGDFGNVGFKVDRNTVRNGGWLHRMSVGECFYHDLFKDEEVPQLTKVFCAMDKAIFLPVEGTSVGFQLDKVLSDGDSSCEFVFKEKT